MGQFKHNKGLYCGFFALWILLSQMPGVFAQQSASTSGKEARASVDSSYLLQAGDRINVKIYPEDEYIKGGEVEVSSEGSITLPLIGKIQVAGKNVQESERAISELLEVDYIVDPQVVIEVLKYQAGTYVVLGQVTKPGTYSFPPGSLKITLLQAVSSAGGFSEVANIKKIKVMRKKTGDVLHVNAEEIISGRSADVEIKADDVVHVSESLF